MHVPASHLRTHTRCTHATCLHMHMHMHTHMTTHMHSPHAHAHTGCPRARHALAHPPRRRCSPPSRTTAPAPPPTARRPRRCGGGCARRSSSRTPRLPTRRGPRSSRTRRARTRSGPRRRRCRRGSPRCARAGARRCATRWSGSTSPSSRTARADGRRAATARSASASGARRRRPTAGGSPSTGPAPHAASAVLAVLPQPASPPGRSGHQGLGCSGPLCPVCGGRSPVMTAATPLGSSSECSAEPAPTRRRIARLRAPQAAAWRLEHPWPQTRGGGEDGLQGLRAAQVGGGAADGAAAAAQGCHRHGGARRVPGALHQIVPTCCKRRAHAMHAPCTRHASAVHSLRNTGDPAPHALRAARADRGRGRPACRAPAATHLGQPLRRAVGLRAWGAAPHGPECPCAPPAHAASRRSGRPETSAEDQRLARGCPLGPPSAGPSHPVGAKEGLRRGSMPKLAADSTWVPFEPVGSLRSATSSWASPSCPSGRPNWSSRWATWLPPEGRGGAAWPGRRPSRSTLDGACRATTRS